MFLPMTATCICYTIFSGHGVSPRCTCTWVFLVCTHDGCCLHVCMLITMPTAICYSYTIVLSGLFELYVRGRCLNHEAKLSVLNARLERTIQ